jgi:hypothetical protein
MAKKFLSNDKSNYSKFPTAVRSKDYTRQGVSFLAR